MIKRQYDYFRNHPGSYFAKFMDSLDNKQQVAAALRPWGATLAKSKAHYRFNVKFHDHKRYTLFVMRWS